MPAITNPFGHNIGHVKRFVHPRIVIEVTAMERNPSHTLRLPRFKRLRPDKPPKECIF